LSDDKQKLSFFDELKRRNVYRVGVAYAVLTWLLLQIVETVSSILVLPELAPQIVLIVLVVGFPVALIFAWAYELTPDGIKREKDVDRSQSITSDTGQRLDRITIAVVVLAVAILLVDRFVFTDAPAPTQFATEEIAPEEVVEEDETPSIAVLPFLNMSDDKSSEYFSDGLADTMLHMLAQVREIRVAARTSSFQFRDQAMDISKIGEQLNVATVLEGSVQRAGDKIRITAQLIDVGNGFHLWSGNFDRDLEDVFAIQDEIANEVVAALKVSLLGEVAGTLDRDQTDNLEAYTEYLLGISDLNYRTSEKLHSAIEHLQKAVELDPEYARAWSTLGYAYLAISDYGLLSTVEALPEARKAANRALELVPGSSEALAVLGMAELLDGNQEVAGDLLSRAIELGPNDVVALNFYGSFLISQARPMEAIEQFKKAMALDPLSEDPYVFLAATYLGLNRLDEATTVVNQLFAVSPGSANGLSLRAATEAERGNFAAAIADSIKILELDPNDPEGPAFLGYYYLAIDMPDEAKRWFDRAVELDSEHPVSLAAPLFLNYYLGNNDDENARLARELLESGIENRRSARRMALQVLYTHSLENDNLDSFLEVLDGLYPNLFDDPPTGLDENTMATLYVGKSYYHNGEVDKGTEFLRAWQDERTEIRAVYGDSRTDIGIELMLGDRTKALETLESVSNDKYYWEFNNLMFKRDPMFDPIRDEPAFIALLEEYERNAAEQRRLIQAANAN
jgi:TolB-like protein/Flp pilus assembly protein TadD